MLRNLFKPDSELMILMSRITDCIFLSLFFIVGCVPVVTVGASFAALYDSAFRGIRKADKHSWSRFLEVYRENWKAGILPTLAFYAAVTVLVTVIVNLWNAAVAGSISWMLFSGVALVAVLLLGMVSVLFPMLSRFDNPTAVLLKNTLLLSLANMPRILGLGIVNAVAVFACLNWVFPLFFVPALAAFLGSFFLEPMFKPYMPPEEEIPEEPAEEEAEE